MDSIQAMIDRLPSMKDTELRSLTANVESTLRRNPDDPNAARLREAIDEFRARNHQDNLNVVDGIGWEPHGPSTMNGYHDGQVAARIHKLENHNSANDGVYQVEVGGKLLDGRYRYLSDARRAAGNAYHGRGRS